MGTRLTKKTLTETLMDHGYLASPCITKCEAGDMRLYVMSDSSYYATINFVGGKLRFNGQEYKDIDTMLADIDKYNSTLEFKPNTYNPDYVPKAVTDMRMHAVLADCGYKLGRESNCYLNKNGVLGVEFPVVFGSILSTDSAYGYVSMYDEGDTDSDKAKGIKSIIGAVYAANIAVMAEMLANMGKLDTMSSMKLKTFNPATMQVEERECIDGIVTLLENTLARLKKVGPDIPEDNGKVQD